VRGGQQLSQIEIENPSGQSNILNEEKTIICPVVWTTRKNQIVSLTIGRLDGFDVPRTISMPWNPHGNK
jgi:hypothetical protein